MAEPEASYLARHGVESTITAAVSQVLKEKPLDPLKRIGQLLLGALPGSALQVELSDAAHDLIHANGWRLGMVGFGSPASESTVRVMSAMCIAASHQNSLPDEFSWVELTYDDKPLSERGGTYIKKSSRPRHVTPPFFSSRTTIRLLQSVVVHKAHDHFMSHPHSYNKPLAERGGTYAHDHFYVTPPFFPYITEIDFLVSSLSPTFFGFFSLSNPVFPMLFPDVTHTPILPIYQRISFYIYIYQRISCFFSPRQTHDGSSLSRVGGALGWCGGDAGDPHRRHHVQRFHTHRPDARHRVPGRNAGPILAGAFSSSSIWPLLNSPTHTPFRHMPHPVSPQMSEINSLFSFFVSKGAHPLFAICRTSFPPYVRN